jgi:hypothetical protein
VVVLSIDDVLNITWLQDANYSETPGYSATAVMTWAEATTWAANLVYGGYSDWRLPTTVDGPLVFGYDGTTTGDYRSMPSFRLTFLGSQASIGSQNKKLTVLCRSPQHQGVQGGQSD